MTKILYSLKNIMLTLLSSFKNSLVCIEILSKLIRFLPYVMPASQDGEGSVDLSTLRTFRVLRPLKLVSGVPSKLSISPPSYPSRSSPECQVSFLLSLPHHSPGQPVFRPLKMVSGVPSKLSFPPPSSLPRATGLQTPQARLRSAK